MNFSLILPSRDRLELLEGLLASVRATADDLDELEAWIAFDEDDATSIKAINRLSRRYPFARFLVCQRKGNMSAYYNLLAAVSAGEYVWALNDDCVLTADGWDRLALDWFRTAPEEFYGHTRDDCGFRYANFPLLSRPAIDAAGYFFHPDFTSWGADINLYDIWTAVSRVVNCDFMAVSHLSHHNGKRERDAVNQRMGQIASYNYGCAAGEAERIRRLL